MLRIGTGLLVGACLCLVIGCAEKGDISLPNVPPETYIALADSVRNPTVYIQTIRWWGADSDGEVVGYQYRWFINQNEPGCSLDTEWTFTDATSHEFHLPVTQGISSHRIEVRAVDDDDAVDPTPSSVRLPVTNTPPGLFIWDKPALPDTTFPAITLKWHADDAEGSETIDHYLVWLDGEPVGARKIGPADTLISLSLDDFGGQYGDRTIHVRAVDSGCDSSDVDTYSWHVKRISGDVLLVDDMGVAYASHAIIDATYRAALDSCIGTYSILDIEEFRGKRYAFSFGELFSQFDLVIWYSEPYSDPDPDDASNQPDTLYLSAGATAAPAYVESGGHFLVASLEAIGDASAFMDSIAFELFGVERLYRKNRRTDFDCKRWEIKGNAEIGLSDLKVTNLISGCECMEPAAGALPLYYVPPEVAAEGQETDYYLGMLNTYGAGKAAILTFPWSRSNGYGNARSELGKVIDLIRN
jgi:hypothetical protein